MATTKPKFAGWSYSTGDEEVSGRRSRRGGGGGPDPGLTLIRDDDGLEVKSGSLLLCDNPDGEPMVVLIKDARLGNADYIDLIGVNLLRISEVKNKPQDADAQELFITSVEDKIYVTDIIEQVNVYNEADFKKVVIDDSNEDTTFLCRRGYDTYYGSFSAIIDFNQIREAFIKNPATAIETLRHITVKPMYKERAPTPTVKREVKPTSRSNNKPARRAPAKPKPTTKIIPRKRSSGLKEHVISDDDDSDQFDDASDKIQQLSESSSAESFDDSDDEPLPDDDEFGVSRARQYRSNGNKRQDIKGPRSFAVSKGVAESIEQLTESAKDAIANLPTREAQFSELYGSLESNTELEQGASYYVSGPPGTGKTVTIRAVINQLSKAIKSSHLNRFETLEINGLKLLTPHAAYEQLWRKVSNGQNVPSSGLATALEDFFKNGHAEVPIVVLLDELDTIASNNQSILYNFFNWPTYEKSKLIVISVANTMDLPERILSNKTSSRLGDARIQFPGYSHEDLIKIIKSKLEILQSEGAEIREDSIEFAARKVASVSGDARRALSIIKRAIQIAKSANTSGDVVHIQPGHINRAINETTNSPVASYITGLTFVGKLILIGILSKKQKSGLAENPLGEVIDHIKYIVDMNSKAEDSRFQIDGESFLQILYKDYIIRPEGFRYALNELIEAGIVLVQHSKSVINERNSLIKLNIADEEISSVFKREKSLKFFSDLIV